MHKSNKAFYSSIKRLKAHYMVAILMSLVLVLIVPVRFINVDLFEIVHIVVNMSFIFAIVGLFGVFVARIVKEAYKQPKVSRVIEVIDAYLTSVSKPESTIRIALLSLILVFLVVFQIKIKTYFGHLISFRMEWDAFFHQIDLFLFRQEPWLYFSEYLSAPIIDYLVMFADKIYCAWFVWQWGAVIDSQIQPSLALQDRFILAFILTWAVGTILGGLFSSVGPCFYPYVPAYLDQMSHLDKLHTTATLIAVYSQQVLWDGFLNSVSGEDFGISAFPSLHVGISYLLYCYSKERGKFVLLSFIVFIMMWVSSVLLAWHYFVDGLGGVVLAYICWKGSAVILNVDAKKQSKAAKTTE